jgi:hypothetical protein
MKAFAVTQYMVAIQHRVRRCKMKNVASAWRSMQAVIVECLSSGP